MKIQKFQIENYKALAGRHEILPEGSSFFLVGANGKGKSSAGRVLIDLLTKNNPSKPVTEGENEGFVEITFDEGSKIMAKYQDGKKPVLSFITSDGIKASTPKDFFDRFAGPGMSFNIDEFLKLAPKPKRAMLEQMVGVDLSDLDQEEREVMEKAKEARAAVKVARARVKPYDAKLADAEPVDVIELSNKVSQAKADKVELKRLEQEILSREERIRKLELELKEERAKLDEAKVNKEFIEVEDDFVIAMWEDDLSKAEEKNEAIRLAKTMKEEQVRVVEAENELARWEEEVKRVRQEKEDAIRANPLPATGLEFDPDGDGLLLNGLPFEDAQVATSAKMIAALQIAEAQLGKIRYLHFDAAILDKENAMRVLAWAEEHDLQLCIERPLWDGGELKMEVWDKTGEKVKEVAV